MIAAVVVSARAPSIMLQKQTRLARETACLPGTEAMRRRAKKSGKKFMLEVLVNGLFLSYACLVWQVSFILVYEKGACL